MPEATVTVPGTDATELPVVRVTVAPEGPAGPVRVTAAVDGEPPNTVVGLRVSALMVAGLMTSVVRPVPPFPEAEMVTKTCEFTGYVVTVKVALVWPLGTVTLPGVDAEELRLMTDMFIPPFGAGPVRVTVPVAEVPPTTGLGLTPTLENWGGLTVSIAVCPTPGVAVMSACS